MSGTACYRCCLRNEFYSHCMFRLHRMHEMLTLLTDVHSVCLSGIWFKSTAARAVYAACHVRGVFLCSLRQMPLDSCSWFLIFHFLHFPISARMQMISCTFHILHFLSSRLQFLQFLFVAFSAICQIFVLISAFRVNV